MATVQCTRCGREADALPTPPVGGQLGIRIQNQICADCWNEWVGQQVLYINHYGLQMADPDDRKKLLAAMKEYLGLEQPA